MRLPEGSAKEDVQVQFLPDHVTVVLKGQKLLEGNLFSSIDHESSTWIIKENNRYFLYFYLKFFIICILSTVVSSEVNTIIGLCVLPVIFRVD